MIHIYCDGGLGNRLFLMISALCFAKEAGKDFIIYWPSNNWTGCYFTDLFDNKYHVSNFDIKFVDSHVLERGNCTLLIHESQITHKENKIIINSTMSKDEIVGLFKSEPNIFYYSNQLHRGLDNYVDDVIGVINRLQVSEQIRERISNYDVSDCIGIHVRGTDINKKPFIDENEIEKEIVSNPINKYFICSDEKRIEDRFVKYENVLGFTKRNYVEKLDPNGGWNKGIIDDVGRSFVFNVNRNKSSSIEAFCDMILLAKCKTRLKTSGSSFLKCAEILAKTNLIK